MSEKTLGARVKEAWDTGNYWDLSALVDRLASAEAGGVEALFPIQGGPAIPWAMIAPHEEQADRNHSQSLRGLAQRGGLAPSEALAVLDDIAFYDRWPHKRGGMTKDDERAARDELEKRAGAFAVMESRASRAEAEVARLRAAMESARRVLHYDDGSVRHDGADEALQALDAALAGDGAEEGDDDAAG